MSNQTVLNPTLRTQRVKEHNLTRTCGTEYIFFVRPRRFESPGTLAPTDHAGIAGVLQDDTTDRVDARTLIGTGTRFQVGMTKLAVTFIFGNPVAVMGRRRPHCLSTAELGSRYSAFRITEWCTPRIGSALQ